MPFTAENSVTQRFISPASEAFGSDILWQASRTILPPALDLDVRQSISDLQENLYALSQSPHPDDVRSRAEISRLFYKHDAFYAPYETREARPDDTDPLPWLVRASHSHMLQFLTWNRDRLAVHQQRIDDDLPHLQAAALQNIEGVAGTGIMPPITKLVRIAFTMTDFVAIDTFEAGFHHQVGGFFYNDSPTKPYGISLANGYEGGLDGLGHWQSRYPYTVAHETWHLVGQSILAGLSNIFNEDYPCSWWYEAEAEHHTQVGFHGEPDITAPSLRTHKGGSYQSHRELSHLIKTDIPQLLVSEAYIEPFVGSPTDDSKDHLVARKELDRLLHRNFQDIIDLGDTDMNIVEVIEAQLKGIPHAQHDAVLDDWRQKLEEAMGITPSA